MAVWSEVPFSEVKLTWRFDAEYYQPRYLRYEKQALKTGGSIRRYIKRIIQPTEFIREYVESEEGAEFWRAQNIKPGFISRDSAEFIDRQTFADVANAHVREGDVLVVRTGANAGDAATVPAETEGVAASSHTLRLVPKSVELGYAIGTFFASDLGRDVLFRSTTGSSRPQITKDALLSIKLPDFTEVAGEIRDSIHTINEKREESKQLYAEAEALLLDALGIADLDLPHQTAYTAMFSEAAEAQRLDAEYFRPKYQRLRQVLRKDGLSLADVAPLARNRFKPKRRVPFDYIEIGNVAGNGFVDSEQVMGEDAPSRAQWIVKTGDIITSTVRPIRRLSALIEEEQNGYVATSGFAVLRPKRVSPELLLVYLRLPQICELLDLMTAATMYPAVSVSDLLTLPFPLPNESVAEEVTELVAASRRAKKLSIELLDEAKEQAEALICEGA